MVESNIPDNHLSLEGDLNVSENVGTTVRARFENKVLKLLGNVDLAEGDEVEVEIKESAARKLLGIAKCWEGLDEAHDEYESNVH